MNLLCFLIILSVICSTVFESIEGRRHFIRSRRYRRSNDRNAQVNRVRYRLVEKLPLEDDKSRLRRDTEFQVFFPDDAPELQLKDGKSRVRRDTEYGDGTGAESITHVEKVETKAIVNEAGHYEGVESQGSGVEKVKKVIYENSLMNFGNGLDGDGNTVVKKSLDQQENLDQVDQTREKSTVVQNLIAESAKLGQELRMVFSDLTSREETLLKEMEELRGALQNAIVVLKDRDTKENKVIEQDTKNVVQITQDQADLKVEELASKDKKSRKTRTAEDILNEEELYMGDDDLAAHEPYRACVYINPEFGEERDVIRTDQTIVHKSINGRELPPIVQHESFPTNSTIDLSSVMWVKLPHTHEDEIDVSKKVNKFLRELVRTEHDILMIPISNKFTNPQQVMRNLLESLYAITPHKTSASSTNSENKIKKSKVDLKEQKIRINQI